MRTAPASASGLFPKLLSVWNRAQSSSGNVGSLGQRSADGRACSTMLSDQLTAYRCTATLAAVPPVPLPVPTPLGVPTALCVPTPLCGAAIGAPTGLESVHGTWALAGGSVPKRIDLLRPRLDRVGC